MFTQITNMPEDTVTIILLEQTKTHGVVSGQSWERTVTSHYISATV